jgi:hypothetical protein
MPHFLEEVSATTVTSKLTLNRTSGGHETMSFRRRDYKFNDDCLDFVYIDRGDDERDLADVT